MLCREISLFSVLAAAATLSLALPALADPAPATQPDLVIALAPQAAGASNAPASQPDAAARRPLLGSAPPSTQAGSQVSFLLTRNLPENLRRTHAQMWVQASAEQRKIWRAEVSEIHTILGDANADLEKFVQRKKQFDTFTPEMKDRYREKAALIDQVIKSLSPAEQAQLLTLSPEERAKRVLEYAAKLKVKQLREGASPQSPQK